MKIVHMIVHTPPPCASSECVHHHLDRRVHHLDRRAFTCGVVTALLAVRPAIADEAPALPPSCSYQDLATLPEVLSKVSNRASGDPRDAQSDFQRAPLLADRQQLSTAVASCTGEDTLRGALLGRYDALRDEFKYQTSKTYDPRWADPEDAADLQSSIKQLKAALEKYLASVPAAQRGAA